LKRLENTKQKKVLEVGIIGAGAITTTLHLPLLTAIPDIKPKYIADIKNPSELARIYKIASFDVKNVKELPDCDIVLIATPVGVREEYIKEFSNRKIPIFTEKPFATNFDEHTKFLNYSNSIACNYMKIWYNSSKNFKKIISSNTFGKLKKISIKEGGIIGKTNRGSDTYQSDKKLSGGGVIMESACHTLSVLVDIFENISVKKSEIVWEKELDVQAKVEFLVKKDLDDITMEYLITLIQPIETLTTLFYENCFITFDHSNPDPEFKIHNYDNTKTFEIKNEEKFASSSQQAYFLTWRNFIDQIKNDVELNSQKLTSLKTTELISKIYELGDK